MVWPTGRVAAAALSCSAAGAGSSRPKAESIETRARRAASTSDGALAVSSSPGIAKEPTTQLSGTVALLVGQLELILGRQLGTLSLDGPQHPAQDKRHRGSGTPTEPARLLSPTKNCQGTCKGDRCLLTHSLSQLIDQVCKSKKVTFKDCHCD